MDLFQCLAQQPNLQQQMIKQAVLASKCQDPIFMFGVQVPRN